jgi:hypothetical protein
MYKNKITTKENGIEYTGTPNGAKSFEKPKKSKIMMA